MPFRKHIEAVFQAFRSQRHKDRVAPVDTFRSIGRHVGVAERPPKHEYNLFAKDVNANVAIAIRAIKDAVLKLPIEIHGVESVDGVDREFVDTTSPANDLLKQPNPEHTLREIVTHICKSYLGDGNAILTKEVSTGPNDAIELWPRDPRTALPVIKAGRLWGYKFGRGRDQVVFPRNRVVHIRDIDPEEPFWGKPRLDSVRVEIEIDQRINEFNVNFFRNGGAINWVFEPDQELSEVQRDQLQDVFAEEIQGSEVAWSILVNRFPGKLKDPGNKHKEIAFREALRFNREKIYGVFGLPPFRGGVMEYANYANALQQDKDFWLNTVMPVTQLIADVLNKQLIWPKYGEDVVLAFNYDEVEALQGDPLDQARVDDIYVKNGTWTQNEVRERMGMEPLKEEPEKPAEGEDEKDPDDKEPEPTKKEEKELAAAVGEAFRKQRRAVLDAIRAFSVSGTFMSHFMDDEREARLFFPEGDNLRLMRRIVAPAAKDVLRGRTGVAHTTGAGAWIPELFATADTMEAMDIDLAAVIQETTGRLRAALGDGYEHEWSLSKLNRAVAGIFNSDRAAAVGKALAKNLIRTVHTFDNRTAPHSRGGNKCS